MHDKIQFSWRCEAAVILMWALGYLEKLNTPNEQCDTKIRSEDELLEEFDLIEGIHWDHRDVQLNGKPELKNVDAGVVMERHYALSWLSDTLQDDWDDVSTDT